MEIFDLIKTVVLGSEELGFLKYEFLKDPNAKSEEVAIVLIYELNKEKYWTKIDDKLDIASLKPPATGLHQPLRLYPYPGNCISSVKDLCLEHYRQYFK